MKEKELNELKNSLEAVVKTTVNGKIDAIKKHLEEQDIQSEKKFLMIEQRIEVLRENIDELKPVAESLTVIQGLKKFIVWLIPIGTAGGLVAGILKWIR